MPNEKRPLREAAENMLRIDGGAAAAGLERVRASICCYFGGRCDCKFGGPTGRGEQTGCPEVRTAVTVVRDAPALADWAQRARVVLEDAATRHRFCERSWHTAICREANDLLGEWEGT